MIDVVSNALKINGQPTAISCHPVGRFSFADVGKWLNPTPLQGGATKLRGFKSHHRLQHKAPIEAATFLGAVITTAEAMATRNPIIKLLAVDLKEIHSDVSQLPFRMPEVWEAP